MDDTDRDKLLHEIAEQVCQLLTESKKVSQQNRRIMRRSPGIDVEQIRDDLTRAIEQLLEMKRPTDEKIIHRLAWVERNLDLWCERLQ